MLIVSVLYSFYLLFLGFIFILKYLVIVETKIIPKAKIPALDIVDIARESPTSILPLTISNMVLYIPAPGTNGIRQHTISVVTGVFNTLAKISEYIEQQTEEIKKPTIDEIFKDKHISYTNQLNPPPKNAKNNFFPFILKITAKPKEPRAAAKVVLIIKNFLPKYLSKNLKQHQSQQL